MMTIGTLAQPLLQPPFSSYQLDAAYDEMFEPDGSPRPHTMLWIKLCASFRRRNCGERHIRVAGGRDYADVPPTRGVHKGKAQSELSVAARISSADAPLPEDLLPATVVRSAPAHAEDCKQEMAQQQQ